MQVGYTKVIKSGNLLEIYQYEKAPISTYTHRRKRTQQTPDSGGHSAPKPRRLDNVLRSKRRFIRLVRANCGGADKPSLITLTMRSIVSLETANPLFTGWVRLLKSTFGDGIRYIGVPEFQKRGAVHFHVLVWGIPSEITVNERDSRYLQNLWGYGYVDCIATDGSDKLAGYLGKYMSKSLLDERISGKRGYYCSSNVLRPLHFKTTQVADHTALIWGVDKVLVHEAVFMTDWLGEGRYYRYNLIESVK